MVVDGYNWFGVEPGYVDPPFKKYDDEKRASVQATPSSQRDQVVVAPPTDIGTYAETARIFAIRPDPPTAHDVTWAGDGYSLPKFPPIRGGILTPPFVYRPDRTATYSNTVYKRVGRGEEHPYCKVRQEMRKKQYEPVAEGVPMEKPEKPKKVASGPQTREQGQMASFAQPHRWKLPRHDGTKNARAPKETQESEEGKENPAQVTQELTTHVDLV